MGPKVCERRSSVLTLKVDGGVGDGNAGVLSLSMINGGIDLGRWINEIMVFYLQGLSWDWYWFGNFDMLN